MMKKIAKDIPHYISLFGILSASLVGFYIFSYDRSFQVAITIALAASYVVWGVVHHHIHRDLYLTVILEYIAVSVVGVIIIYSLILSS